MADKRKATVIITRGKRADLRTEIDVIDKQTGKREKLNIPVGPSNKEVDRSIRQVKEQLERSGCEVSFKEM